MIGCDASTKYILKLIFVVQQVCRMRMDAAGSNILFKMIRIC